MPIDTSGSRKSAMERALKVARAAYKRADMQGEVLEREIKRVLLNKKVYSATVVEKLASLMTDYRSLVDAADKAMADFVTVYMEVIG